MSRFCIVTAALLILSTTSTTPAQRYRQRVYQNQNPRPASQSFSQSHWTQSIPIANRSHSFGVVPSYSSQEHIFEFTNPFNDSLQITGVRASCGCTKPSIVTHTVKPGETGQILAKFDTKNFQGDKKATVSVSIRRDQPFTQYGEIQFSVAGTIRRDIVLDPGTVLFENMTQGEPAKRTVKILYAGNINWQIASIESTNPNITVTKKELQRDASTRRVDYELTLGLTGDQTVGPFKDQLMLTTTDKRNKKLAINVQGNVRSVIEASSVKLGAIPKGFKIEKRLIIRGVRPFAIKDINVGDKRIKVSPSEGSKTLHVLTYQLDTSKIGNIVSKITINTDDPNQAAATVPFEAQIVPETYVLDNAANR